MAANRKRSVSNAEALEALRKNSFDFQSSAKEIVDMLLPEELKTMQDIDEFDDQVTKFTSALRIRLYCLKNDALKRKKFDHHPEKLEDSFC